VEPEEWEEWEAAWEDKINGEDSKVAWEAEDNGVVSKVAWEDSNGEDNKEVWEADNGEDSKVVWECKEVKDNGEASSKAVWAVDNNNGEVSQAAWAWADSNNGEDNRVECKVVNGEVNSKVVWEEVWELWELWEMWCKEWQVVWVEATSKVEWEAAFNREEINGVVKGSREVTEDIDSFVFPIAINILLTYRVNKF
jgi:hypothetical protein